VVAAGLIFFFSSRRRHTRFSRDWSSDVCSSDLRVSVSGGPPRPITRGPDIEWAPTPTADGGAIAFFRSGARTPAHAVIKVGDARSEERRVGKECRSRWRRGGEQTKQGER